MPGTHPFRIWGYGTTDPLSELLGQEYFRAAGGLIQPGDLIYVSTRPRRARADEQALGLALVGEMRMALMMVRARARVGASVRLVQDFGRPDDPDHGPVGAPPPAPAAMTSAHSAARRARGRPPGSRTRKPAPMPAVDTSTSASGAPAQENSKIPGGA